MTDFENKNCLLVIIVPLVIAVLVAFGLFKNL